MAIDKNTYLVERLTEVAAVENNCEWRMGDIGLLIEQLYGCRKDPQTGRTPLQEAALLAGVRYATLQQRVWVARKFPVLEDRMYDVSWTSYRAAASSDDPQGWLGKAASQNWTSAELIRQMRVALAVKGIYSGRCYICGKPVTSTNSLALIVGDSKRIRICSEQCLCTHTDMLIEDWEAVCTK